MYFFVKQKALENQRLWCCTWLIIRIRRPIHLGRDLAVTVQWLHRNQMFYMIEGILTNSQFSYKSFPTCQVVQNIFLFLIDQSTNWAHLDSTLGETCMCLLLSTVPGGWRWILKRKWCHISDKSYFDGIPYYLQHQTVVVRNWLVFCFIINSHSEEQWPGINIYLHNWKLWFQRGSYRKQSSPGLGAVHLPQGI